MVLCLLTLIDR